MHACIIPYYNTKTKLDLTKLFLLEVSQLHVQIYIRILKNQKIKVKNALFPFKKADLLDGMLIYVDGKFLFVTIRDWNILFSEDNSSPFNHFNFSFLYKVSFPFLC